jgi:predicted phage terminase large subunit-like protein
MVVSAREERAIEIVALMLNLIREVPMLAHLKPRMEDLQGRKKFVVGSRTRAQAQASVRAFGILSQITGQHVDHIIADDIEIPENSTTVDAREKLLEKVREFEDILNPGGTVTIIGTPQTEDSIYFKLATQYETMRIPAEYPDPDVEKSMKFLAEFLRDDLAAGRVEPGDPTMPEKFDRHALDVKKSQQGRARYSLQMLLDPAAADESRYPLKLRDFVVHDLSPHFAPARLVWGTSVPAHEIPSVGLGTDQFYRPIFVDSDYHDYERSVMRIDPAGMGADQCGYAVVKALHGNLFCLECDGLQGGYDEPTLKKLLTIGVENGVQRFTVESNWGGSKDDSAWIRLFSQMVGKLGVKIPIEPVYSTGQKELRIIEALEPVMSNHRLVISPRVGRNDVLMRQLTRLTRERGALDHDDQVEALAGAVSDLSDTLSVDVEKQIAEHKKREFEEELRRFGPPSAKKAKKMSWIGGRRRDKRGSWL